MAHDEDKKFSEKHGPDAKPDIAIRDEILKHAKNEAISCAVAFQIAEGLGVSPAEVGKNVDLLDFRLIKCQMGLYGHTPETKVVKKQHDASQELKDAISEALLDGKLSCKSAWDIAARFNISKLAVSGACEAMEIKIKNCQLGAF
ncbi:hypothetical protein [Desulfonema magnum]|uniref:Uncharacterized protein n=1 Tax=Desulfonema magnum TaxID=45655 RepID=A0A975BWC2_9BACT|nr:hypothetical protein [Desulfonema magnum]QTA92702.1 Uncharacterized protein dnm_087910 [Desulfonema magnum]